VVSACDPKGHRPPANSLPSSCLLWFFFRFPVGTGAFHTPRLDEIFGGSIFGSMYPVLSPLTFSSLSASFFILPNPFSLDHGIARGASPARPWPFFLPFTPTFMLRLSRSVNNGRFPAPGLTLACFSRFFFTFSGQVSPSQDRSFLDSPTMGFFFPPFSFRTLYKFLLIKFLGGPLPPRLLLLSPPPFFQQPQFYFSPDGRLARPLFLFFRFARQAQSASNFPLRSLTLILLPYSRTLPLPRSHTPPGLFFTFSFFLAPHLSYAPLRFSVPICRFVPNRP